MANDRNHDSDSDSDDAAWFAALRGRPVPSADARVNEQAADLRQALLARHARHARISEADLPDPAGLERLQFRLRREGLAEVRPAAAWRLPAALAATIALGVAIGVHLQEAAPGGAGVEEPLRGGSGRQVQTVPDVQARAVQIAEALRTVGADVAVIDAGDGAVEVAATLPAVRRAEAAALLARFGLRPPGPDGALRIELRPSR